MKIEKIESVLAGDSHIVRIITDNGIEGIGQSAVGDTWKQLMQ